MSLVLFGNAMLLLSSFVLELGLFGDTASDEDESTIDTTTTTPETPWEPDTPEDDPISNPLDYVAEKYAAETIGTDGDDDLVADGVLDQAWFLQNGDDTLDASHGDDFVSAGDGNDEITLRIGDDIALGGNGDDTIDGGFGDDTISGGFGDDQINGSKDDDWLLGDLGNDLLTGSDGADSLQGDAGDDTLFGNHGAAPGDTDDGADTLDGGAGDDLLAVAGGDLATGGEGADDFRIYDPGDSGALADVTDFNAAEDVISLVYTPQTDPVTGDPIDPELTLTPTADGVTLTLSGVEIARITGGQTLTPGDIALIPSE